MILYDESILSLLWRLTWQLGEVVARRVETAEAVSLTFAVPNWQGHLAGQHADVRLTAEDVYQAEHSYSIASQLEERVTLTRTPPPGWTGYRLRIDSELHPLAFICGPIQLVETAASSLLPLGYEPARVKTERFGPTGGS